MEALRRRYVMTYFGRTITAIERLAGRPFAFPEDHAGKHSDVIRVRDAIRVRSQQGLNEHHRVIVADLIALEDGLVEMTCEIRDFTEAMIRRLRRPAAGTRVDLSTRLVLMPEARFLAVAHDWETWLARPVESASDGPPVTRVCYLAYRDANRIVLRRLGPFTELVLRCFQAPVTPADALREVLELAGDKLGHSECERMVVEQVHYAYRAGVLEQPHLLERRMAADARPSSDMARQRAGH